jgi:hypothetical protein
MKRSDERIEETVYLTYDDLKNEELHEFTMSLSYMVTFNEGGMYEPPSEDIYRVEWGIQEPEYENFFSEDTYEAIAQHCAESGETTFDINDNDWVLNEKYI